MDKVVFIVDDNEANLATCAAFLESEYKVHTMTSAKKMFDLIELHKQIPDLILLDVEMPEMTGFDAIHELKKRDKWRNIPVVFLTGWEDDGLQSDGRELGGLAMLGKPFDPDALLECVRKHIN